MWKSEHKIRRGDAETRRRGEETLCLRASVSPCLRVPFCVSVSPRLRVFFISLLVLLTIGCRRDMQDQPRMKPLRATTFFRDGISSRPPVTGTVPRGFLRDDKEFFTGKKSGSQTSAPGKSQSTQSATGTIGTQGTSTSGQGAQLVGAAAYPDDLEVFPMPITNDVVKRGKERFEVFCSACHGMTGYGDGMIVRRGFRRAASFHSDALRQAPVGHYFDAITNGWGAMPSYATQIPVQDRWAIIAYIRALQLSQQNTAAQSSASQPAATPAPTPAGGHHQ